VWAVTVAISISGLFVRRFVVRPVWLGEVKWESGLHRDADLTLMLTYLAGLWIGDENELGQVIW